MKNAYGWSSGDIIQRGEGIRVQLLDNGQYHETGNSGLWYFKARLLGVSAAPFSLTPMMNDKNLTLLNKNKKEN